MKKLPVLLILTVCGTAGHLQSINISDAAEPAHEAVVKKAICVIRPLGDSKVEGAVLFTQRDGFVEINAELTGLSPGLHGFHVHEFGDCTMDDGTCAGGHFNPTHMPHGGPDSAQRHAGDLGNLGADQDGVAELQYNDRVIQLTGPRSIVGRSIIIHEKADDLKTQPSGDAGKRIACGVIGIAKPD
jgi:Cu-Zn family superoxide dismutase